MAEVLTASFGLQATPKWDKLENKTYPDTEAEQRNFTFHNRRSGEGRFDGCVADGCHLAGVEVSGKGVGLAG